ncbi:MAG: CHC2 zinc finger domain-containing protein, partial [Pseudomonadota bacterium]
MIPRAFINELIARCDIAEVIDARVPLRKAGHDFTACCPFHSEKTPSFTVSPRKQFYHCFGCGVSGNVLGFLMAFERLEFVEAVEMLASHMGMVVPEELPSGGGAAPKRQQIQPNLFSALERSAKIYQTELRQSSVAIEYLKGRGLSGQICKTFGIGYAPSQWDCLLKAVGNTAETRALLLEVGMLIPREER